MTSRPLHDMLKRTVVKFTQYCSIVVQAGRQASRFSALPSPLFLRKLANALMQPLCPRLTTSRFPTEAIRQVPLINLTGGLRTGRSTCLHNRRHFLCSCWWASRITSHLLAVSKSTSPQRTTSQIALAHRQGLSCKTWQM